MEGPPEEIPPELLDPDRLAEELLAHAGDVRDVTSDDLRKASEALSGDVEADIERLEREVGEPSLDDQDDDPTRSATS